MSIKSEWEIRINSLPNEGKAEKLHMLACELLRLSAPMLDNPSMIANVIAIAERYRKSQELHIPPSTSFESTQIIYMENNAMTQHEYREISERGPIIGEIATKMHRVHQFVNFAMWQFDELVNAKIENSLGNSVPLGKLLEKLRYFYNVKEKISQFHGLFQTAAEKLDALLLEPRSIKTLDRLSVFRSFIIHKSFWHVAAEQELFVRENEKTPDHTGPAYKVRKLGESLGVQLTCLSSKPGRSKTELTPAGHALADWIKLHPELFS